MRQDPDIIMVGEIRDKETAATAIDAALTGHLVFSTLHTNSAAGAIPRLIDLGVNPKVIGPAVNLALAQRLVRTLCQKCKKGLPLNPREEKIVKTIVDSLRAKGRVVPEELKLFKGVGCNECHKSGYTGRIGIFEGILIDEAVERVIVENPSEYDIARAAAPQGLLTMREDGILKVLEGKTSFEELERVVDLE
jgi:type IV pilus assembly protein PilB